MRFLGKAFFCVLSLFFGLIFLVLGRIFDRFNYVAFIIWRCLYYLMTKGLDRVLESKTCSFHFVLAIVLYFLL